MGKRVLCLDFDPQCHLAKYLGHKFDDGLTITDYIFNRASYLPLPPTDGLVRRSNSGIDFIPSSLRLSRAETVLAQAMFREQVLRDILEVIVPEGYDYLLIDCNPSMGILLTNALVADRVLIPVQTEEFSVDGLEDMMELIQMVKANINPHLGIVGLLPTLMTNTKDSRTVAAWLKQEFTGLVFDTGIGRYADAPRSVKAKKTHRWWQGKIGRTVYGSDYGAVETTGGIGVGGSVSGPDSRTLRNHELVGRQRHYIRRHRSCRAAGWQSHTGHKFRRTAYDFLFLIANTVCVSSLHWFWTLIRRNWCDWSGAKGMSLPVRLAF